MAGRQSEARVTKDHRIEHLPPGALTPCALNALTQSRKHLRQIADSIRTFGFTNPALIDAETRILAGHGRVAAALSLGMATVPCVRLDHMTPEQRRAYVIADNKLALNAGWDDTILAEELEALIGPDLDFGIEVIGFEVAEIDRLIDALAPEEDGDPEDDALPGTAPSRVRPGDLWQLGSHRLICGDSLDPGVAAQLMAGETARMIFTDPPSNVAIDGHRDRSGKSGIANSPWPRASEPSSPTS